eukprot:6212852-Pleurochrysis_carterae.AAC.7
MAISTVSMSLKRWRIRSRTTATPHFNLPRVTANSCASHAILATESAFGSCMLTDDFCLAYPINAVCDSGPTALLTVL